MQGTCLQGCIVGNIQQYMQSQLLLLYLHERETKKIIYYLTYPSHHSMQIAL